MTVWYAGSNLHTRQSSTQNNKYQVLHKHSCFSWWWAHSHLKHVEIDKYTKDKLCTKLALFTRKYHNIFSLYNVHPYMFRLSMPLYHLQGVSKTCPSLSYISSSNQKLLKLQFHKIIRLKLFGCRWVIQYSFCNITISYESKVCMWLHILSLVTVAEKILWYIFVH